MAEKPYNSVDEYIAEHIAADALPAAIGRGAKKFGAAFGREFLGMKSMDAVLDGQDAQGQLVNDFIGFARQQGWDKSKYTMGNMLAFYSQRYDWMPDDEAMLQIANFAKKTFGSTVRKPGQLAEGLKVSFDLTTEEMTVMKKIKAAGNMPILAKAMKGENLSAPEIRELGGFENFEIAMRAIEKVRQQPAQQAQTAKPDKAGHKPDMSGRPTPGAAPMNSTASPAAAAEAGHQPDMAGGKSDKTGQAPAEYASQVGSFQDSPEDHRAKWMRLQQVLPGRAKLLSRMQMDKIAQIVARDMLRRNLMVRPENADKAPEEKSEKTKGGTDARRNPSRDSLSPSGSMVSIREFMQYAREGGAPLVALKALEQIGETNMVPDIYRKAAEDHNIGENRLLAVLAAFAMSFRLKKEARKNTDLSYDNNNRYISCRHLTQVLLEEGISAEVMEEVNKIGESSINVREVMRAMRGLGTNKLHAVAGCLAKSMRIMSEAEMKQALKQDDAV